MDIVSCSWVGTTDTCSIPSMVGDMQYPYKSLNKLMFSYILSCLIFKTALVFSVDISIFQTNKTSKQTNKIQHIEI